MSQPVPTEVRAPTLPLAGEERDWAVRIRAGEAAAFERAFRTYLPALCQFACRYVHSREVAQELVHDVFATLWEERARLRVGKLKSYLYAAVRNSAVSHLRHERVERRWREQAPAIAAPLDENEGERRLEAADLQAVVERVLSRLPERCRLALALRWQRQMSYAEVAAAMGISVKTVEIYVGRGFAALRKSYQTLAPHR